METIISIIVKIFKKPVQYIIKKIMRKRTRISRSLKLVEGGFKSPLHGDRVSEKIKCTGWVKNLKRNQHLWVVVEVGGLIWPKEEIFLDGEDIWEKTIFEGGNHPDGEFSISLYVANIIGHYCIINWFDESRKTGNYYGLSDMLGTRRLDYVNLTKIE